MRRLRDFPSTFTREAISTAILDSGGWTREIGGVLLIRSSERHSELLVQVVPTDDSDSPDFVVVGYYDLDEAGTDHYRHSLVPVIAQVEPARSTRRKPAMELDAKALSLLEERAQIAEVEASEEA